MTLHIATAIAAIITSVSAIAIGVMLAVYKHMKKK